MCTDRAPQEDEEGIDMIKKLTSTSGFSMIEWICSIGIAVMLLAVAAYGLYEMRESGYRSDDHHLEDTARRAATINYLTSGCVVDGCPGMREDESRCEHYDGEYYWGYLNHRSNRIEEKLPEGYNYSTKMKVDGEMYRGDRKTMVIQVHFDGDQDMKISWVPGLYSVTLP